MSLKGSQRGMWPPKPLVLKKRTFVHSKFGTQAIIGPKRERERDVKAEICTNNMFIDSLKVEFEE
jgi:hypothetical protein